MIADPSAPSWISGFSIRELLLVGAMLAVLLGVLVLARFLGKRFDWAPELQRKSVHIATGCCALTLPLLFARPEPVLLLMGFAAATLIALRLPALSAAELGRALHGVERRSYGDLLLAVAIAFTFAQSVGEPVLYVLPIAVIALSDAAAALAGVWYGRNRFTVEAGEKSLEGAAIFFLVTVILAMTALLLLTDAPRANVVLLGFVLAAFATMVEAESWRGFDNLFVPVGVHIFLARHLESDLGGLATEAALFTGLVAVFLLCRQRLGLSGHAARASSVLVFLILSATAAQNAIPPLVALGAHLAARRRAPCASAYPDLDFLAAAAGVSLFWLFVGDFVGVSAINLFTLTFAAIAAGHLSAARLPSLPIGVLAVLALSALVIAIAPFNRPEALGAGPSAFFALFVFAAIALGWATPKLLSTGFDRNRALRLSSAAMVAPVVFFIASLGGAA